MKLSVITLPTQVAKEAEAIKRLLDEGAYRVHLRKPEASADELRRLLDALHPSYLNRVVMHYHLPLVAEYGLAGFHFNKTNMEQLSGENIAHKSYSAHGFAEALSMHEHQLEYCFLSPIFESISKEGYAPAFTVDEVGAFVTAAPSTLKLFALGGVCAQTIGQTKQLGFAGAALLGAVWQNYATDADTANVIYQFKKIKQLCDLSY